MSRRDSRFVLRSASILCLLAGLAAQAQTLPPGEPAILRFPSGKVVRHSGFVHGKPVFEKTDNVDSAATINIGPVRSGGALGLDLTGSGETIGQWEAGGIPSVLHTELFGRALGRASLSLWGDEDLTVSDHASHVAGTMIARGSDPDALGMAPQAEIYVWDSDDNLNEVRAEAALGLELSNHSYGWVCGWEYNSSNGKWYWYGDTSVSATEDYKFGYYSADSAEWDDLCRDYPEHLPVFSAGNDRNDAGPGAGGGHYVRNSAGSWVWSTSTRPADGNSGGYDSMHGGACVAKNVLTIGAVNSLPGGYTGPSSVSAASFSAFGPTDDGRIKPDVVADGVGVYSCISSGYGSYSGTSMAAPATTGALALLREHFKNTFAGTTLLLSSTFKGLLIHTADEAGSAAGPDYKFGWGLVNVEAAAALITAAKGGTAEVLQDSYLGSKKTYTLTPNGNNEPIRVTLCYIDEPGAAPTTATLDPATRRLVNDLDMVLKRTRVVALPGGGFTKVVTTYRPWVLNPASPSSAATTGDNDRDNVERIDGPVGVPMQDSWTLEISHETLAAPTTATRVFSLIISGARM